MFTRGMQGPLIHQYTPQPVTRVVIPGAIRAVTSDNIVHTWAISRPVTAYEPTNAPLYYQEDQSDCGDTIARGGTVRLIPARPRVAMDPSNRDTWQRSYRF